MLAGLVGLLFVCLPLGPAPLEIATGLLLLGAVGLGDRGQRPLVAPVLLVCFVLCASALGRGRAAWIEALGLTWPLALAVAMPMVRGLLSEAHRARAAMAGTLGIAVAVAVGVAQVWTSGPPATGLFSHHLTLAYALVPAGGGCRWVGGM